MLRFPTQVAQRQVDESNVINDTLPLLQYDDIKTLEDDLNYLRSVLKQLKGTAHYDTPLIKTLEAIREELEAAVFHNAHLSGESTADTPPLADKSNRIATTEFVSDKIDEKIVDLGADARFVYRGNENETAYEWNITHNLGKFPSVTCAYYVDNSWQIFAAPVRYIDENRLVVLFGCPTKGIAFLN